MNNLFKLYAVRFLTVRCSSAGFTSLLTLLVIAATAVPASTLLSKTLHLPSLNQIAQTTSSQPTQRIAESEGDYNASLGGYIKKIIDQSEVQKCEGSVITYKNGATLDCKTIGGDLCIGRAGNEYCIDTHNDPPEQESGPYSTDACYQYGVSTCTGTHNIPTGKGTISTTCFWYMGNPIDGSNRARCVKDNSNRGRTCGNGYCYAGQNYCPSDSSGSYCSSTDVPKNPSVNQCERLTGVLTSTFTCRSSCAAGENTYSGPQPHACTTSTDTCCQLPETPALNQCERLTGVLTSTFTCRSSCAAGENTYSGPQPHACTTSTNKCCQLPDSAAGGAKPVQTAPQPTRPSGNGYCGGDNHNPATGETNSCPGQDTFDASQSYPTNSYCQNKYGGSFANWYKCSPANAAGDADAPLIPPGADSKQSTKSDICGSPTQGGVDVAQNKDGYLAPICISTPPTSSTYTTGLFNSAFATYSNTNPYTLGKYYDVFKCVTPGQYDFSPRPPTAGREGICNKPPWTPYSSANPPPAGTPTCSDPIKPYYNPDSKRCEPRPDACPNIGPNGGANTCQAAACASGPDVAPNISSAESNQACTSAFPGEGRNKCCLLPSASSQLSPTTNATITVNTQVTSNGTINNPGVSYTLTDGESVQPIAVGALSNQGNNRWSATISGLRKKKYILAVKTYEGTSSVDTTVCASPFTSVPNNPGFCQVTLGDSNVSQTFTLTVSNASTAQPGSGTQPGTNAPAAPVAAPGTLGGTCNAAGSCGGSANNSCEYGWTNSTTFDTTAPNRYCCAFGERYCTITGTCMSDRSQCAAPAQSANPGTTGGGTAGSNGTGNAFSGDHCYSGDNACAPGYYCQGYQINSATAHCAPVSSGSTNTNPPATSNTGNGTCQTSANCPTGQACTAGVCTISPAVVGIPAAYAAGNSCPAGRTEPNTFLEGTYCNGSGKQVDMYCGSSGKIEERSTGASCTIASNTNSSSIASVDEKINTCVSNSQCVKSKLGSACVYTNNPNVGVCK